MKDPAPDWDARYRAGGGHREPAEVLREHLHLLPRAGTALDLACGLGAHARLLAERGLTTWAWDASAEAVRRLQAEAEASRLAVHAEHRDVILRPPEPGRFDVIVVVRFLDRSIAPALTAALKPGGRLFYQTFTRTRVGPGGPDNPAFLLEDGELLRLFGSLRPRVYREEGLLGDTGRGLRGQAFLVAERP